MVIGVGQVGGRPVTMVIIPHVEHIIDDSDCAIGHRTSKTCCYEQKTSHWSSTCGV
jgi:hypothetical protein